MTFRYLALIRGGLITNIFDKLSGIRTKAVTRSDSPIMTLIGTDVERICETWNFLIGELWASILQLGFGVWLLQRQLGAVCIAPIVLAVISTLICAKSGSYVGGRQSRWLEAVQTRVNFTSHALSNIGNIKMLGYTSAIEEMIQSKRLEEIEAAKRYRRLSSFNVCLVNLPDIIGQLITFAAFAIVAKVQGGNGFNTTQAITSLAILSIIMSPLSELLYSVPQCFAALGCFQRIQNFLNEGEIQDDRLVGDTSLHANGSHCDMAPSETKPVANGPVIRLQDATIGWESPIVHNVSFSTSDDVRFIALVGPVASGKSTIVSALLGEARIFSGSISLATDDISFCQQTPWLPSGTLQSQIIATESFSKSWYDEVVAACALDTDIAALQHGDQTEVGAQGVSLSGGQRQRVAVARALYSRKPIAIFDDILSALDSSTQDIVVEKVFGANGILRRMNTAVVLATHSTRHLHVVDSVVTLTEQGHYTTRSVDHSGSDSEWKTADQEVQVDQAPAQTDATAGVIVAEEDFRQEADDLANANKNIGDLAVYAYYFASLGWPSLGLFSAFILTESGFSALQRTIHLDVISSLCKMLTIC